MKTINRTELKKYKRYCKTMSLENDPKLIESYKKIHAPGAVWSEITEGMLEVGIIDMEIYISGNQLFMIMDTVPEFDHDQAMRELAGKPKQAEWEAYVSEFQRADSKSTADEKWRIAERIYKLDK